MYTFAIFNVPESGTLVICSNTSSPPEVVGDAAVLVNPRDIGEIAEAMALLISNESLRQELKEKGLKRAAQFSWERTARETLKVYEEVTSNEKLS